MPRQGLNRESVVEASIQFIEEKGYTAFSMGELAKSLNVKTASLYNHVESVDALFTEVGLAAVSQMVASETQAIKGKEKNDALFAIAAAYRTFAKDHNELYRVIMSLQKSKNKVLERAAGQITEPILQVLSGYGLSRVEQIHWQRILRSMMHGFVAHEELGGFSHYPADKNESYQMAVQCIADGLQNVKKEQNEDR
ncbi:MAG: TetR/AcrR family transcriptional regulator [Clostridiaceae bacterium]|nr:TetR/AcrR family transcriptional regulator [Clostridiaceae bacterium]